jgi:putative tryptophan/tyrosine transport system substrate-binding protein
MQKGGSNGYLSWRPSWSRSTTLAALPAKHATHMIPTIMAFVGDPVAEGLVERFAHPGGDLTGLAFRDPELTRKWLNSSRKLYRT